MTGMSAFLNACLAMTIFSGTPLSLASLTYSLSSTSSMQERVSRNIDAAKYQPSASDGITRCQIVPEPEAGSQRKFTANTMIISRPTKKPGTDSPSIAMTLQTVSQIVSTLTAVMIPAGCRSGARSAARPWRAGASTAAARCTGRGR